MISTNNSTNSSNASLNFFVFFGDIYVGRTLYNKKTFKCIIS